MKKITVIIIVFLSLNLIACAIKQSNHELDALLNTQLNNNTFIYTKDTNIYLTFDNGSIYGSTGLNNFMGMYEIKDNKLILYSFGITRTIGSHKKLSLERKFVQVLISNPKIKITNNGNILYIANKYRFKNNKSN